MSDDIPEAIAAPRQPSARKWGLLALVGALIAAGGGAAALWGGEELVTSIRVTKHGIMPEYLVEKPDYYVLLHDKKQSTIETNAYEDTLIGNGLDFKLPKPIALAELATVELMDEEVLQDDMLDRVDVLGRVCRGQTYEFELQAPPSQRRKTALAVAAGGGALLALAAIMGIRALAA